MNCKTRKNLCNSLDRKSNFNSLEAIVNDFSKHHKDDADAELNYYSAKTNTFATVVKKASRFEYQRSKKHPHQHRINLTAANKFKQKLHAIKESELKKPRHFDELLNYLNGKLGKILGIGDLTIYDTATRLGAYFELSPQVVYLHTGTRQGAINLLGDSASRKAYLSRDELPNQFGSLNADQIENLLCIYKDQLTPNLIAKS